MKYITLRFLFILSLVLTPTISTLKLPNPSSNVLIVNHLNYLRYDYLSNPTSLRTNGYPFYSSSTLNRSDNLNRENVYPTINRTNDLDLILTGQLDEHLNQQFNTRLNILNEPSIIQINENFNTNQLNEPNQSVEHQETQSIDHLDEEHQLNGLNELNDELINEQNLTNSAQLNEFNQVKDENNDLNDKNFDEINNEEFKDLSLLQEAEPSSSTTLDLNSSFLNEIQGSDESPNLKDSANENQTNQLSLQATIDNSRQTINDSILNDFFHQNSNVYIEENLDELLNSPTFNLLDYAASNENILNLDTNLPEDSSSNSDIFLSANIDDIANNLISSENINFLSSDNTLINQDLCEDNQSNLESLINNIALTNDFSSLLNQDLCISNQQDKLKSNLSEEATCSTSNNHQISSDNYIGEYISEEDLELMCFSNLQANLTGLEDLVDSSGANNDLNDNLDLANQDQVEVSSDSAISSMSRSDWFDSGSESSSHFDEQFHAKKERYQKSKRNEKSRCTSSNSNIDDILLLDNFEINDSNLDLFEGDAFNDQLLNLDESSRFNSNDFTNDQDVGLNSNNHAFQRVLHNHTYIDNQIQNAESSSHYGNLFSQTNSITTSISETQSSSSSRTIRENLNSLSLDSIRNRRQFEDTNSVQSNSFDLISVTSETSSTEDERSLSRDQKKARDLQIPISVCEIINMPIDEFNERLTKYELNEMQLSLIRDIRRRGKNKVAAQNCRKRKINQIVSLQTEVDQLQNQKDDLMSYYDKLFTIKELAQTKYEKLYDYIAERSQTNAALLANFESLNFRLAKNHSDELNCGAVGFNHTKFDENDTNQLNEMPSTSEILIFKNLTMDIKPTKKVLPNYKKALAMN